MTYCVCKTSENCEAFFLQDKCNIEIFMSAGLNEKHLTIGVNNLLYCSGCEFSCQ